MNAILAYDTGKKILCIECAIKEVKRLHSISVLGSLEQFVALAEMYGLQPVHEEDGDIWNLEGMGVYCTGCKTTLFKPYCFLCKTTLTDDIWEDKTKDAPGRYICDLCAETLEFMESQDYYLDEEPDEYWEDYWDDDDFQAMDTNQYHEPLDDSGLEIPF